MKIIDHLSAGDLNSAKNQLLSEIYNIVGDKTFDLSPQYKGKRYDTYRYQPKDGFPDVASKLTYFGLQTLNQRYFLRDTNGEICEDPQMFFYRVALNLTDTYEQFVELFTSMANLWFMPATPILSNVGTTRGLPISCFLNTVGDSVADIYKTFEENAFLSKGGGGIGTDWSSVRGSDAEIKSIGGKSSGVIPFLKVMDSSTLAVSQGGLRRGAAAAYLRIDHPDIEEFLEIRKPTGGDDNRRCLNLHHGVSVTDEFMEAVDLNKDYALYCPDTGQEVKRISAKIVWRKLLKVRAETGEPYILFIDTVNASTPQEHKDAGLLVKQSNLCSEITLPTNKDRTAVCCLGSLNLEKYDEYALVLDEVVASAVRALDKTLDLFLQGANPRDYKRAINSVRQERSIGLGVMGWNGYLMYKRVPFESPVAISLNKNIFSRIQNAAEKASKFLALELGTCLDSKDKRNMYLTAIAPTANISVIAGESTPGIEPLSGMAFMQKTLSGSFLVKNKFLESLLVIKGMNTQSVWDSIIDAKGSVQHLDFLTQNEKDIYKTAYEINPSMIIRQASDRQKYICQSQSLNLFLPSPISGRELDYIHKLAWKLKIKSLYYVRTESVIKKYNIEDCSVCQ